MCLTTDVGNWYRNPSGIQTWFWYKNCQTWLLAFILQKIFFLLHIGCPCYFWDEKSQSVSSEQNSFLLDDKFTSSKFAVNVSEARMPWGCSRSKGSHYAILPYGQTWKFPPSKPIFVPAIVPFISLLSE